MSQGPSMLSLIAAAIYALVVVACIIAGFNAKTRGQQFWHMRSWFLIGALFALLMVMRMLNAEELLRADLREWLRAEGLRDGRRVWQGVLIAVTLLVGLGGGLFLMRWMSQRLTGRRNIAVVLATGASGVMIAILAMRTISLHAMDALLYGPLKLNWVGDIGASFVILAAAIYYTLLIRGKIGARRR